MDWQAVAQIINSVGLVVVAGWSTYLTYRGQSTTFEEILYRRRIEAVIRIHSLMLRAEHLSTKYIANAKNLEVDFFEGLPGLEDITNLTAPEIESIKRSVPGHKAEKLKELNESDTESLRERANEMSDQAQELKEISKNLSEEVSESELFIPKDLRQPIGEFTEALLRTVIDRENCLEDLSNTRDKFIEKARKAIGTDGIDKSLRRHW